nr:calcium-transporting ATPase 12, plasma membrane-type-like [Tanacetum cinerariifolium]
IFPEAKNPDDYSKRFSNIDPFDLTDMVKNKDIETLHRHDGVTGFAKSLHTNLEHGIISNDIESRKIAFGSNTYKKPPPKGFLYFVVEAFKDPTILILLACATLSLGFGIKEEGAKEGWYEGGSIFVAVLLVIAVSA